MALSLATVGGKITAAFMNLLIGQVNATAATGVVPTSVAGTGVTVGASGKVTAVGATSVNINGCFTSTYENYLIIFSLTTTTATGVNFMGRLSGTDTATGYDNQRFTIINATATPLQALNATSANVSAIGLIGTHVGKLEVYAPQLSTATYGNSDVLVTANPMTTSAGISRTGFLQRATTAFDGFTMSVASGTITGNIRIYGYNTN